MPTTEQMTQRLQELRRRGAPGTRPLTRSRLIDAILDHRLAIMNLNQAIP